MRPAAPRLVMAACLLGVTCLTPARASAQDVPPAGASPAARWIVRFDASIIGGLNYQNRKFTDFWAIESQNWVAVAADRESGEHRLSLSAMLSLERLTMRRAGSHQVFQTGETLDGAPLIDLQHPHDVVMNLGARYSRRVGRATAFGGIFVVGSPALGPEPFMHRPSAELNPQVPLSHHYLDATHVTSGVVTGGLALGGAAIEASWFHGREPDENRWDLDVGTPDSWSVRGSWAGRGWAIQASGARIQRPEALEPFDVDRLTVSVSRALLTGRRPLAWTIAWGQNREFYGRKDAYLAEATWRPASRLALYGRAEFVTKNILTAGGLHPPGFTHPHVNSRVGAATFGLLRDLTSIRAWTLSFGGDMTGYVVPPNLEDSYGRPWSFHLFLRLRAPVTAVRHVH